MMLFHVVSHRVYTAVVEAKTPKDAADTVVSDPKLLHLLSEELTVHAHQDKDLN